MIASPAGRRPVGSDGFALSMLLDVVRGLMDICGACERIHNTPLAYSYCALLRHGTLVYTVLAPIYTVRAFGFWGLPLLVLVFYFVIGLGDRRRRY